MSGVLQREPDGVPEQPVVDGIHVVLGEVRTLIAAQERPIRRRHAQDEAQRNEEDEDHERGGREGIGPSPQRLAAGSSRAARTRCAGDGRGGDGVGDHVGLGLSRRSGEGGGMRHPAALVSAGSAGDCAPPVTAEGSR